MNKEVDPSKIRQEIRWKAMDLLARREHSRQELLVKLSRRFPSETVVSESILDDLEMDGMLSDQRFAEAFVSSRKRRGYGPARIRRELMERGVHRDLIDQEVSSEAHDWYTVVEEVWSRRFGSKALQAEHSVSEDDLESDRPVTSQERLIESQKRQKRIAKQIRFLQYRGFSSDHIQSIMG